MLYIVTLFLLEVGFSRYEEYTSASEIYEKLILNHINVDLVCAYMVIGNMHKQDAFFAGYTEFSCSEPFLAYTYWFLMSKVFLEYKPGNHIPGLEVPLHNKPPDETN